MKPTVSIIVPTFNRPALLAEAVASVSDQTYPFWQLIVVDDGSGPDTLNYLNTLSADPRIVVIRRPHIGIAATRNIGLDHATGDYVAFLDSDDRYWPDKLARQVAGLEAQPAVGWSYTGFRLVDDHGIEVPADFRPLPIPHDPDSLVQDLIATRTTIALPTVMMRRLVTVRFDERLPRAEDYDLLIQLAQRSLSARVKEVLYDVREHAARTTNEPALTHIGKAMVYKKTARRVEVGLRALCRRRRREHVRAFFRAQVKRGDLRGALSWWLAYRAV